MSILTTFDLSVSFLAFALSLLPVPHSMHRLRSSSDRRARKALDIKGKDLWRRLDSNLLCILITNNSLTLRYAAIARNTQADDSWYKNVYKSGDTLERSSVPHTSADFKRKC